MADLQSSSVCHCNLTLLELATKLDNSFWQVKKRQKTKEKIKGELMASLIPVDFVCAVAGLGFRPRLIKMNWM